MLRPLRLLALFFVSAVTTFAWMLLGGVTSSRTSQQRHHLDDEVAELWGSPQDQQAPTFVLRWSTDEVRTTQETDERGKVVEKREVVTQHHSRVLTPTSTRLDVRVDEDVRRKGLLWFPLYDVGVDGTWTWRHDGPETGHVEVVWAFADRTSTYDGFTMDADGVEGTLDASGSARAVVPVSPGQEGTLHVRYRSRGADRWTWRPTREVGVIEDFTLDLHTDFADIDYPGGTLSPSTSTRSGTGWDVQWRFERLVAGSGMGVVVPCPVQPGELAASLAWSAPISLGLFMAWITVLGVLRDVDVHPVNHALLAAAFFSFHMLFGYTADRIPVTWAFALSSVVSVVLVVTYLIRVVSPRFAVIQAGGAQLVYLVGFGAAHFAEGSTGLVLTVIGVGTLFALMQLTAHVRWGEVAGAPEPVQGLVPR